MSFKEKFYSLLKVIFIIAVCGLVSLIFVWPMWLFSHKLPNAYTFTLLSLILLALIFILINKIRKTKASKVMRIFLNLLFIFTGLYFSIFFLYTGFRLYSLISLLILAFSLTILNLIFKKIKNAKEK